MLIYFWRLKYLIIFRLIFFFPLTLSAQQKTVAFTFDDLPAVQEETAIMQYVTRNLLSCLKAGRIPATGFVNEAKLYNGGQPDTLRIKLMEQWLSSGFPLGNHTFSHVSIDQTDLEKYQLEIMKGEQITRPLTAKYGSELKYFRHPQLRTGPTEEYRLTLNSFLAEKNYITAPVTMDNDEYIFAHIYARAKKQGNASLMESIAREYIAYMDSMTTYYEDLTWHFFGRPIPQTLLLHANELNADHLPGIIALFRKRNYAFISLDEALTDPAYRMPEAGSPRGISWIHRWMLAQGITPQPQPTVSQKILDISRLP